MGQQRLIWADSLKGILILLVVMGHAIQGYYAEIVESNRVWNIIYSFHMPAFFAISGYFIKPVGGRQNSILRRVLQLLIPYFTWAFLKLMLNQNLSWNTITKIVTEPVSFWFLWVLFWVYIIFQGSLYLQKCFNSRFNHVGIVIALVLIGIMALFNTKLFAFHLIAYYFAFYVLGFYMGSYKLIGIKSGYALVLLSVIWFFLACGWSMHDLPSWMPKIPVIPSSVIQMGYRFVTAFIAIIVLLNVTPLFLSNQKGINRSLNKLGFYSLGIYVTHYLMIWSIASIIKANLYLGCNLFDILLIFSIALIVSLLMVWLLNKNKYTAAILLGKVQKK